MSKIQIELSPEEISRIVREDLVLSYEDAKTMGGHSDSFFQSLKEVIKHYSTPDQIKVLDKELSKFDRFDNEEENN